MATRRRASRGTLTGNITDLQRRVRYLQAKPVPSKLANQVVTRTAIQPRAVSTDQIALAAITNDQVAADAIRQEQLANLSVGNPELQNNAVLNRNIAQDAVNATSIEINAVGSSEIADNAVGSGEIADNAVTGNEIADSAVGSSEIATDAVTQAEIAPNSVGEAEIINGSVTTDKLGPGAVTADKIFANTITNLQIGPNAVGQGELADNAVIRARIQNGAVNSDKLADSSVINAKIANLAVTNGKIADNTIDFLKMNPTAPGNIVARGLIVGGGLTESRPGNGYRIDVQFGSASGQVARGDHTHQGSTSFALTGANRHTHSVTTGVPSTKSVKKEITTYSPQNIKNLLKLESKRYKYKRSQRSYQEDRNTEWMYGFLIEELLALGFSEPVMYGVEGEPEALDYSLMSMLVLELVKVQQTEIDSLKEEVTRLKDAK